MADEGMTIEGLAELRRAIENLPGALEEATRAIAWESARAVHARAVAFLRAKQTTVAHALADAITIEEDRANRVVRVVSKPPRGQPGNVTLWNEYGTVRMTPRAYMRPAADLEIPNYIRAIERAVDDLLARALG